jgi:hypothetical protein
MIRFSLVETTLHFLTTGMLDMASSLVWTYWLSFMLRGCLWKSKIIVRLSPYWKIIGCFQYIDNWIRCIQKHVFKLNQFHSPKPLILTKFDSVRSKPTYFNQIHLSQSKTNVFKPNPLQSVKTQLIGTKYITMSLNSKSSSFSYWRNSHSRSLVIIILITLSTKKVVNPKL